MRLANLLFIIFMLFGAVGCSTSQSKITKEKQQDVTKKTEGEDLQLYNAAKAALQSDNYPLAAENFGALAIRYPFNNHAQQALLETAEDIIKRSQTPTALTSVENFIKQNLNHPNVDYAYYHRGLIAFFASMPGLEAENPAAATPQASARARHAFQYLAELLQRTPNSKFAADTTQRMLHIRNTLARHEVNIAKYYLTQGEYARAASRAKYVMDNYQQSPAVTDALAILTQANAKPIKVPEVAVQAPLTVVDPVVETMVTETPVAAVPLQQDAPLVPAKSRILSQNPEHYTLQLFSTGDEKIIKEYIIQHNLSDKADYFRSSVTTYALIYGTYPAKEDAQQAIDQLPAPLTTTKPWIRSFKSIRATLQALSQLSKQLTASKP